jgi:serine/threonine protein kinase
MTSERACPRCGKPMPADVPAGLSLCPQCLLEAVANDQPLDPLSDAGDPVAEATVQIPEHQHDEPLPHISSRYRLLQRVAEGGMGVVYKAEQHSPVHRTVAVKLIKLGMDTKQVIARFESERQALAMLNHPNVAAVYDAGATDTGRPYFVMEWVPGEPITEFCDRHNYTTKHRLELFIQACDAIQHAHQKAIIHRDIKPTNLLVMLDGDKPLLKVIDFGVAKATAHRLTEQTMFTEQGQLIGTPEYMSPEQAEMNALDIDTRTDIYSLGVVLYELLTGAVPFDSTTLREAAYAQIQRIIREVDPPRPSTRLSSLGDSAVDVAKKRQTDLAALEKQLRAELEWIPLKAMRKEPGQRYQSATELADDVQNYLQQRPLVAGPRSAQYRLRAFCRRNRRPVAAVAAIALALIAGAVLSTAGFLHASRQRSVARQNELLARNEAIRADREAQNARDEAEKQAALNRLLTNLISTTNAISEERRSTGRTGSDVALALETMAALLVSQGRLDEAEEVWREVIRIHTESNQKEDIAWASVSLARVLRKQGKTAAAQRLYPELEARCRALLAERRSQGAIAPTTRTSIFLTVAGMEALLGETLLLQAKFAEAEPLLLSGYEGLRSAAPTQGAPYAGELIVELYEGWQKRSKAAQWRAKLATTQPLRPIQPNMAF